MRELRKETETLNILETIDNYRILYIRNERTPRGDGN